jgi:cell wall-associated NlpC family hydrolase
MSQYLSKSSAPPQMASKPSATAQKVKTAKQPPAPQKKPTQQAAQTVKSGSASKPAPKAPASAVDKEAVAISPTEVKKAAAPLRSNIDQESEEQAETLYSRDPRLSRPTGASPPSNTAASREPSRNSGLVRTALSYRGAPYRYGASNGRSFDCSGFTSYIFRKQGINLPHNAASQFQRGHAVAKGDLRTGDLVFFRTRGKRISHVGIYIGNSQFVHASSGGRQVKVDTIASGYYKQRYAGARRVK